MPHKDQQIKSKDEENRQTYSYLDDIRRNEIDALETADDGAQLSGRPPTSLGRACGGGKGRVERVDVNAQVDGVLGAHPVPDLADDALGADGVNLTGLDDLETAVAVILVVAGAGQGGPDTRVDVCVVLEQTLHGCMIEVRAVVDGGNLGGRAAEDLGLPSVEMAVKVDDRHRPVGAVDGPQQRQGDGVVATQGNDSGQRLALERTLDGRTGLIGVGGRLP